MTNDAPAQLKVLDLVSADLSGIRAHLVGGNVLRSDFYLTLEHSLGGSDVNSEGEDNYIYTFLLPVHRVQSVLNELAHKVNRSITLPVASDNVFALRCLLLDHFQ